MLSKFAKIHDITEESENKGKNKNLVNYHIITYDEYCKNDINLKKYKLPQLKAISKYYKLHITGSKPVLIDRITTHFNKVKKAIIIQRVVRGHFVRYLRLLRGPAFTNRKLCVNETDFYTLEPLDEIPNEYFYSFQDENNFIYGFSITSLVSLIKKQNKTINPYNREPFKYSVLKNIVTISRLINIISNPTITNDNIKTRNNNTSPPTIEDSNSTVWNSREILFAKLTSIRANPVNIRIQELFMEIDLLGNYTQSSWFENLTINQYSRMYRDLYRLWYNSGILSYNIKQKISPYFDPFRYGVQRSNINEMNIDEVRDLVLTIIENIIYSGTDIEIRKIATLHVLSSLTIVSQAARENLSWLYESLDI